MDLGIEVILAMFSHKGLADIFEYAIEHDTILSDNALRIYSLRADYIQTIDDVILFLQGQNQTFARQICTDNFLPQANRLLNIQDTDWAFGSMGVQDHAKHIATLYLEDLSDFIVECVDDQFGFSRYAERLGRSANSFDELYEVLQSDITYIDHITLSILSERMQSIDPKLVCFSVPFPGNLYSAFRCAQYIKRVTVEQVAQVTRNFTEAGVMVHAYLMYGYPTQTIQETVDSLEMVRQLLEQGVIQSGFWHQFALTAHSPVGLAPADYGIEPHYADITFANNDVEFTDSTGIDHDMFSEGLRKSLFNYMHGICFDYDLQEWFDFEIPQPTIDPNYILDCIESDQYPEIKSSSKIIWLGNLPTVGYSTEQIKGRVVEMTHMTFHDKRSSTEISMRSKDANWLINTLEDLKIGESDIMTYGKLKTSYEESLDDFTLFWYSDEMSAMREIGLLVL